MKEIVEQKDIKEEKSDIWEELNRLQASNESLENADYDQEEKAKQARENLQRKIQTNKAGHQGNTSELNSENLRETGSKETRELTDEEREELKEKLGWTDKQLNKCTIDEDGVIHYRTDREDLEGKTAANGVKYKRKTVEINGVKVEGVFPEFKSEFDCVLPENLLKASNPRQFGECNRQLCEAVKQDDELAKKFTPEQLDDIKKGYTPEGYTWHHSEEQGKMQLVETKDHDRTQSGAAHTGGKVLWGGGYGNSGVSE